MTTRLIIARHGNTFEKGDIVRRVGAGTDLPLSNSGKEQAARLGQHLAQNNLLPTKVFCSHLQRTAQTAQIAMLQAQCNASIEALDIFNEIDYGPDENQAEEQVIARLGHDAIKAWDQNAIVPSGWNVDPQKIVSNWQQFAHDIELACPNQIVLVVTSNGIARFAPCLMSDAAAFQQQHGIKMSTGALSVFTKEPKEMHWCVLQWNHKPA